MKIIPINDLSLADLNKLQEAIAERISEIKSTCKHEPDLYRSSRDIKNKWPYSYATCKKCESHLGYICTGNPASPDGVCKYSNDTIDSELIQDDGYGKYYKSSKVKLLDGSIFTLSEPFEYSSYDMDPCCIFCHHPDDPPQ